MNVQNYKTWNDLGKYSPTILKTISYLILKSFLYLKLIQLLTKITHGTGLVFGQRLCWWSKEVYPPFCRKSLMWITNKGECFSVTNL